MPKGIYLHKPKTEEWKRNHSIMISGKNHPNYKDGRTIAKKHCSDCNKLIEYRALKCNSCNKKGIIFSQETRKKLSKSHYQKLDKHWNWQGGKTKEIYPKAWNLSLKEKIRIRDNHTCQICNIHQSKLTRKLSVHHINYFKNILDENNLVALCGRCHALTNTNKDFWERFFYYGKNNKKSS